jgi:hypothetical protein
MTHCPPSPPRHNSADGLRALRRAVLGANVLVVLFREPRFATVALAASVPSLLSWALQMRAERRSATSSGCRR